MPRTKESGRAIVDTLALNDLVVFIDALLAERDALTLVAEAVINGEWEAARELADAALAQEQADA